jgi:hypothetical protein
MPFENEVVLEQGINYFYVEVMYVTAENPGDGEIPAPLEYDVHAYIILPRGHLPTRRSSTSLSVTATA